MFLRPVRWGSQQLPHGLTASRPSGVVTSSRSGSPPEVESRIWPNLPGSPSDPTEFPSVWDVSDVSGSVSGVRFGSLEMTRGTPLCVGKPRNGVWQLRFSVKIRWDVVVWRLSFFFWKKNRSSSSRRPERHANTKEVDISTKRVRTGGQGTHCDELRVLSPCHCQVEMFQALSEQKGAEKSSGPESCQHSRQEKLYEAHDPVEFFSKEETLENSVDTLCFSQLRMLEDQYLLSLLVLPRKFLWTDHFFLEMEDA